MTLKKVYFSFTWEEFWGHSVVSSLDSHHESRVLLAFCTSRPGVEHTPVLMVWELWCSNHHTLFSSSKIREGEKGVSPPFQSRSWISYPALLLFSHWQYLVSLFYLAQRRLSPKWQRAHLKRKVQLIKRKGGIRSWEWQLAGSHQLSQKVIYIFTLPLYIFLSLRQLTYCLNPIKSSYPSHSRRTVYLKASGEAQSHHWPLVHYFAAVLGVW